MPLTREKKEKIISQLREKIKNQKGVFFIGFSKLKVKELSEIRKALKKANSELKITKKTLIDIAFKRERKNVKIKELAGEVGLAFAFENEISLAKILYSFSKKFPNLRILGGLVENEFLKPENVEELAKLPSKEEIFMRMFSSISAPLVNFVEVLKGNLKGLVYIFSEMSQQKR